MNRDIEYRFIIKIEWKYYTEYFSLEEITESTTWLLEDWRNDVLNKHCWEKWLEMENPPTYDEYRDVFTGLFDFNWDKVYESDIISIYHGGIEYRTTIEYHESDFWFILWVKYLDEWMDLAFLKWLNKFTVDWNKHTK